MFGFDGLAHGGPGPFQGFFVSALAALADLDRFAPGRQHVVRFVGRYEMGDLIQHQPVDRPGHGAFTARGHPGQFGAPLHTGVTMPRARSTRC